LVENERFVTVLFWNMNAFTEQGQRSRSQSELWHKSGSHPRAH
jgi:hypothetical protein